MIKIYSAPASPYSAKVRMAARHAGIPFEAVYVDTVPQSDMLTSANPLGKIPVLVTPEGESIYDSRVITQWLNREAKGALFPRNAARRTEAERMEALADGICDCLLLMVYERRLRPEEFVYQPWLDGQWSKVTRALDVLNANPPSLPKKITVGHIAIRAMLGYAELRFAGKWSPGRTRLKRWAARFDAKFPDLQPELPA